MLPPFTTPYGAFAAISGDVQVEYLEEDEEPQEEEASEGEDDSSQEGEPVTKKPKATGPVTAGGAAASGVAAAAKKKPETTAASSAAAAKKSRASSVTDASAGDSSAAVGAKPPPLVTPDPRISLQVRKIVERVTGKIDTEGLAASSGQATPVATAAAAAVAAAGVTSGASTPAATVAKAAKSAPETPAASTLPVKEGNAPRPTGGSTGKPETESPGQLDVAPFSFKKCSCFCRVKLLFWVNVGSIFLFSLFTTRVRNHYQQSHGQGASKLQSRIQSTFSRWWMLLLMPPTAGLLPVNHCAQTWTMS